MIGHFVRQRTKEPVAQAPFIRRANDDEIIVDRGLEDGIADVGVDYGRDFCGNACFFKGVAREFFGQALEKLQTFVIEF